MNAPEGRVFRSLGSAAIPPNEIEQALDLFCLHIAETRRHLAPHLLDEIRLVAHRENRESPLVVTTTIRLNNRTMWKPWNLPDLWRARIEGLCGAAYLRQAQDGPFYFECFDPCPPPTRHRRLALHKAFPGLGPPDVDQPRCFSLQV